MNRTPRLLASSCLLALGPLVSAAQQAGLSPAAAAAEQKLQEAFSQPKARTRGFAAPAAKVVPQTRSGSVIRTRGPVPTFLPPAAAVETTDHPDSKPPAPPPIPKDQVDLVTTTQTELRVDPVQKIDFENILFDLDSATVKPDSQEVLRGIATALKKMPERRFLVEGHTCDLGDEADPAHNVRLSCLRAEAVCGWLIYYGVSPGQIRPLGFGSQDPVLKPDPALSKAANEPVRQKNRRAVFRLLVD